MKIQITILFILVSMTVKAQTYVDIPWREGMIKIADKEKPGMIRLGGDLGAPWLNHRKVYFVTIENFAASKNHPGNKVISEFEPEDIQGYSTYTEDENKKRIDMKFVTAEVTYMDGLAKKKQVVFLQLLDTGSINTYKFIPMAEKESSSELQQQANQRAILASTTYFRKGDGPYLSAALTEMTELLAECPEVVNKVKAGNYGFVDLSQRPKKKGLGGMWSNQAGDNELEEKICMAVSDYNQCVK